MEHADIRTQLLQQGVKESPILLVERKFEHYQKLGRRACKATGNRLKGITLEAEKLLASINEICSVRKIGNPLNGEAIEYLGEQFIVEFIEKETKYFRAVVVRCDTPEYAEIEAERLGSKIFQVKSIRKIYL